MYEHVTFKINVTDDNIFVTNQSKSECQRKKKKREKNAIF